MVCRREVDASELMKKIRSSILERQLAAGFVRDDARRAKLAALGARRDEHSSQTASPGTYMQAAPGRHV